MDQIAAILVCFTIFVGMPWVFLHYRMRSKTLSSLTADDEDLLNELYHLARRLDDRMRTVERLMADKNPEWREDRRALLGDYDDGTDDFDFGSDDRSRSSNITSLSRRNHGELGDPIPAKRNRK